MSTSYRAPASPATLDAQDFKFPREEVAIQSGISNIDLDAALIDPDSGVKRGLKTRHLAMLSLAGIIGPGLLIGSGGALSSGGPASLIIGFGVIGLVAFSIMQSLGELTTLYPSGGAFTALADRFVDKAFGVAVGWNYFIIWVAVLANEYNVISSIFVFWSDKVPLWGYFDFLVCLPCFSTAWRRSFWRSRILACPIEAWWSVRLLRFCDRLCDGRSGRSDRATRVQILA